MDDLFLTLAGGGGGFAITKLVDWFITRKKEAAEVKTSELYQTQQAITIWRTTAEDLKTEVTEVRGHLAELRQQADEMRVLIESLQVENRNIKALADELKTENANLKAFTDQLKTENTKLKNQLKNEKSIVGANNAIGN